jgi:PAS domain-containing protein
MPLGMDKLNVDTRFQEEHSLQGLSSDNAIAPDRERSPTGSAIARKQLFKIVALTIAMMAAISLFAFAFPDLLPGAVLAPLLACSVTIGIALLLRQRLLQVTRQDQRIASLEAELQKSQVAEDLAAIGTWEHDLDTEQLWFSVGALKLFGMAPDAMMPSLKGFLISVHPEDQVRWSEAHRRAVRQAAEAKLEYRYKQPDGETIWVRSVAQSNRNSGERSKISRLNQSELRLDLGDRHR